MNFTARAKDILHKAFQTRGHSFRWALGAFLVARAFYGLWSLVVLCVSPIAVQNLTLLGYSVVSAFDLQNSHAYFYVRDVEGQTLQFRPSGDRTLVDLQSGSHWELVSGRAISGPLKGNTLEKAPIVAEKIFPYHGVQPYSIAWLALWQRFDTNWFLKIAERGYSPQDGSTAFFPLYPLLTHLLGSVIGDVFLASLLVSAFALIAALFLFHKVSIFYSDIGSADRALVYLLTFPMAFFLFGGYAESTYLMFVLGSFLFAQRRRWPIAALLGAMAALTRGIGILLFIPLIYMWWVQGASRHWRDTFAIFLVPLGVLSYLGFTGLSAFNSYRNAWHAGFALPWQHFSDFVMLIVNHRLLPVDIFNMLTTVLFGILCLFIWLRLPRELGLYSISMYLLPLFGINPGQPFVSMARYVIVIFPAFILLGQWGGNSWINRMILYLSFPAALYFSAQFWMWGWVG